MSLRYNKIIFLVTPLQYIGWSYDGSYDGIITLHHSRCRSRCRHNHFQRLAAGSLEGVVTVVEPDVYVVISEHYNVCQTVPSSVSDKTVTRRRERLVRLIQLEVILVHRTNTFITTNKNILKVLASTISCPVIRVVSEVPACRRY